MKAYRMIRTWIYVQVVVEISDFVSICSNVSILSGKVASVLILQNYNRKKHMYLNDIVLQASLNGCRTYGKNIRVWFSMYQGRALAFIFLLLHLSHIFLYTELMKNENLSPFLAVVIISSSN